jgi:hypothetical protein
MLEPAECWRDSGAPGAGVRLDILLNSAGKEGYMNLVGWLQIGSAASALVAAVFWFRSATNPPPPTYEGMAHFPAWAQANGEEQPMGSRVSRRLRAAGRPRNPGSAASSRAGESTATSTGLRCWKKAAGSRGGWAGNAFF